MSLHNKLAQKAARWGEAGTEKILAATKAAGLVIM